MSKARDLIRSSVAALGPIFLPSIRPLAVPNDFGDELVPAGSAVLVWYRGQRYILSAAHVVEQYPGYTYYIGTGTSWVEVVPPWRVNTAPKGGREEDHIDLAFYSVGNELAARLDGCEFLPGGKQASNEALSFTPPFRSKYVVLGYRNNAFKIKRHLKKTFPESIAYAATIASLSDYDREKLAVSTNLVLDYKWDEIVGEKGPQLSPKLEGISGGAIIRMPAIETPGDLTRPTLVGITIEERRQSRLLVGTRLGVFYTAIDRERE